MKSVISTVKRRDNDVLFKTLSEELPVGVCIMQDGRFCYVNRTFPIAIGYTVDELMGKGSLEIVVPDDREMVKENTMRMLKGELRSPYQFRVICKDGGTIWVMGTVRSIQHHGKRAVLGNYMEITGRKETEEALRQSEERYRTILEEMEDSYFEVDLGGHLIYVNRSTCRNLGYSKEELIGMSYKDFTAEEDTESVFRVFGEVYQTGMPNNGLSWKVIRKDGTPRFAEASVSPLKNHKGEITGFRGVGRDITERRKAEEALRQSEERYRTILEEMQDSYFEVDLGGHFTFVDGSVYRNLGYSKEELIGMSYRDFTAEEDTESVFRVFGEVHQTGMPNNGFCWKVIRKDGTPGFAEASISLLRDVKGEIVGFRGVGRDITERRKAEEALRQSEERYRTILDAMQEGYYEVDIAGNFTFVNDAMSRILGYSRDELIGLNYKTYTPAEAVKPILEAYNRVYRTGELLKSFPMPEIRKDGTRILAEDSVFPLRNEKGDVLGFRGISRDITERKRMEEALRQSEENYRMLFDNSVIGTIVLDAETMRIVMANQAAARLFEFDSVEEGIGLNPLYLIVPEDKERVINAVTKELFEQDLRMTHEFRAITKRGTRIWISATGARIMHEGKLAGLISFTDISEQRSHRDRLVMTDRLASLGEMASGAAHELNNPLTTIIGFSQLLLRNEVPDGIREDLKLINSEAERAADVTRNLLTFAGRHPPMQKLNQINNIIEDVLRLRVYDHKARGIEVERQLALDLPEVMVDYFQMQQVFMNIIINAEYFMINAHNRGTLAITTKEENDTVVILFTDDGPGIPPENLGRVFDPFFTTKEAGKGTGLGLSICHGIVTEHGGQIYARSQLGKGTTIVVELPVEGERRS